MKMPRLGRRRVKVVRNTSKGSEDRQNHFVDPLSCERCGAETSSYLGKRYCPNCDAETWDAILSG